MPAGKSRSLLHAGRDVLGAGESGFMSCITNGGKLGRYQEALTCYDRALQIDPNNAMSLVNKGADLVSLGRDEEALALYEQAAKIRPDWAIPWHNIGLAQQRLGREIEAREALARSRELGYYG